MVLVGAGGVGGVELGGVGLESTAGRFLFGKKRATKNIIHQKKRLAKKNSQKLYPLVFAKRAGQKAISTHKKINSISQIAVRVCPKNVIAVAP